MNPERFERLSETRWRLPAQGRMQVPGEIYADEALLRAMDDKVAEQVCNVACLPGIVQASLAMPDAHWGYGFPIGGVAAFDPEAGGVISAGGVGFDVACGVRALHTGLHSEQIRAVQQELAEGLFATIPAGVGSRGKIRLDPEQMDAMLAGGACWAVDAGYGEPADLARIEERGCLAGADPACVSERAKRRQRDEMGTLGSGNHYLEVQRIAKVYDAPTAAAFGLETDGVLVSIHCGSRGLGHQIGTEFLREMDAAAGRHGIELPERELACAPIRSALGERYLAAMRAAANCALANRQILTRLARRTFGKFCPDSELSLLYDVSHNTCKIERHAVNGQSRELYVHRKGATRAFGPGHPDLPIDLAGAGQPVLIGGSMGTASYVLAGGGPAADAAFDSACHGAGRAMSRRQAKRQWRGDALQNELAARGILIRSASLREIAEEAPGAYKDVEAVVWAAEHAGLARVVARLEPLICIKG